MSNEFKFSASLHNFITKMRSSFLSKTLLCKLPKEIESDIRFSNADCDVITDSTDEYVAILDVKLSIRNTFKF